jgi:hypothetical protein
MLTVVIHLANYCPVSLPLVERRDFVSVAGPLGVTHFLILTATEASSYLRVAKVPRGPTLTCRIKVWPAVQGIRTFYSALEQSVS